MEEVAESNHTKFRMIYSGGFFSCQEMNFTVTSQEQQKARGNVSYTGCKYSDGQSLIGNKGRWQAEAVTNVSSTTVKPYVPKYNAQGEEIYVYET